MTIPLCLISLISQNTCLLLERVNFRSLSRASRSVIALAGMSLISPSLGVADMNSLFDQSTSTATLGATEHLLAVAERHLAGMPALPPNTNISPEVAIQYGNLCHTWMMLYA